MQCAGTVSAMSAARIDLTVVLVAGIFVQLIGAGTLAVVPADLGQIIGWILVAAGSIATSMGVVGWGVLLGLRAHQD